MAWLKYLKYILIPFAAVLLMSHNTFAEGPSILSSDDDGELLMSYSYCTRYTVNNRYIIDCSSEQNVSFNKYDTIYNSDTGEYELLWRYPIVSNTIGPDKYLKISRLTYNKGIPVPSGSNVFFRVENTRSSMYLGTGREFFTYQDYGNRYQYNLGGLNAYIVQTRWNEMFSCPDQEADVCQLNYHWNETTGLGSTFRLSNAFTLPQGWQQFSSIDILHNVYDQTTQTYEWTPYTTNSVLYLLNTQNDLTYMDGNYYVRFSTNFNITSEFYDMQATADGVNVNDVLEGMLDASDNISSQSPLDLNIGNSATATNLISYISTFVQYITNVSPAQNCNLSLPFPNIMGGTAVANLCQGKDTMGNLIPVISSIVIFAFYIPFALFMLRLIYREIRSFTNG